MSTSAPSIHHTDERLDNGLRLILSEDRLAPVVAVNIWYNVGSRHERAGKTGFAHLFEHMMFQGSRNVAKGEHFKLIQAGGGSLNATTWLHRTNYFESGPSNQLELYLWLEADRMGGLLDALGQETLDNQRDVVKNERRQSYENQPYGTWWLEMIDRLFPDGHPYHHPTIGSMDDLTAASVEDCHEFFRTYYTPNNAVLSIVGDIDSAQAREWVQRYFGAIPPNGTIPAAPDPAIAIGGFGPVREVIPDRVPLSRVFVGFRAPPTGSQEANAVEMASALLARGSMGNAQSKTARLFRTLVKERRLAQSVEFFTQGFPGVSVAGGSVTALPETDLETLEHAFYEVIESIADGVGPEELERARAGVERQIIESRLLRVSSRANFLSECATLFDDPDRVNREIDDLHSVTPDQIVSVAAQVFRPDNRVTLVYVPGDPTKEEV